MNTLLASVIERVRELGLLQALGMRPAGVLWQIVLESWLILAVGMVAGALLGLGAIGSLEGGIDLSAWAEGAEMMGVSRVIVPEMRARDLIEILAVVVLLGLAGSVYPGWRAVKIDPLAALNRR